MGKTVDDPSKLSQAARDAQKLIERSQSASEAAWRIADSPAMQAMKELRENSAVGRLLADMEYHEALIRLVQAPLEELRGAGILDQSSEFQEQLRPVQEMYDTLNARFTQPDVPAAAKLMDVFRQSSALDAMARYGAQTHEIQRAMEPMHTPWLETQESLRWLAGFAEIRDIGTMLARMPTFDDTVSAALRTDLGDWRDKITWPETVLTDLCARGAFYADLGFDPSLTNFPALAFQKSAEIAGLRREPPPLVDAYGDPVPRVEDNDEEEALVRTNMAHDWLQRLETNLRRFIDARMTAAFGAEWPGRQLPNGVYDQWIAKREAAVKAGRRPMPLIAYADFTDYERVICKKDNWRQVFVSHFGRPESLRESFQRLHLIRLDTMHARAIGQDDELLLYVEVKRLINAIVI